MLAKLNFKEDGTLLAGDTSVFIRNGAIFAHYFRQMPIMQK
jgi:hypothetical protein